MILCYVGRVTANESLNAKAKEFAEWIRQWGEMLIAWNDMKCLQGCIEAKLEELNEKYSRTKAFELYNFDSRGVYICPKGKPDTCVASMAVYKVENVMVKGVSISLKDNIVAIEIKDK